jgi:ABC-type phosphate transport system substrate-binding protein
MEEYQRNQMMIRWLLIYILSTIPVSSTAAFTYSTKPIVYIDNKITHLTVSDVRDIFLLNITKWRDGTNIVVITFPPYHYLQQIFIWEYFGLNQAAYAEKIASHVQAGSNPPIQVTNEFEMINKIQSIPGSIGFVGSSVILHTADGVKSIPIEK